MAKKKRAEHKFKVQRSNKKLFHVLILNSLHKYISGIHKKSIFYYSNF